MANYKIGFVGAGKMASAIIKVQQGLTVLVCNFGCPASGVKTICFGEAKRKVCSQQAVPISLAATLTKEQMSAHIAKTSRDRR